MVPALRVALQMIHKYGFKTGIVKSTKMGIPRNHIDDALYMASKRPDKYLPKWHFLNKRRKKGRKEAEQTLKDYFAKLNV